MSEGKQALKIDLRLVCAALLAVIVGMLVVWKPWNPSAKETKKISVTGTATVKAEPDQYQFSPYYEKDTLDEIKKLSTDIVAKLKELGVKEKDIKTSTSSYDKYPVDGSSDTKQQTTLQLTVTLSDKDLSQKVQDYLVTTDPKGSISPFITFSDAKSKTLKEQASKEALEDAKKQAEQRAAVLGQKVGKVIEIKDESSISVMPYALSSTKAVAEDSVGGSANLTLQPGESDYPYSAVVVFELK